MNTSFNGVSKEEFKRICTAKVAKEAWTILETVHEGTQVVKASKLQMLATRLEEIRMGDDESFDMLNSMTLSIPQPTQENPQMILRQL